MVCIKSPSDMIERARILKGDKDNMSASTRDLCGEQWQMAAEICERLDRLSQKNKPKWSNGSMIGFIGAALLGVVLATAAAVFLL